MEGISATQATRAVRRLSHDHPGIREDNDDVALEPVPEVYVIDLLDAREDLRAGELLIELARAHGIDRRELQESIDHGSFGRLLRSKGLDVGLGLVVDDRL